MTQGLLKYGTMKDISLLTSFLIKIIKLGYAQTADPLPSIKK